MKKYVIIFIMCLLAGCSIAKEQLDIEKTVKNLGLDDKEPMDQIEKLYANPYLSARLLSDELHVVPIVNATAGDIIIKNPDIWHVIWCIRGLQFLTGKRFIANTAEKKSYRIQKFLQRKNPLPFFSDWMSREYLMLAPKDVQIQIISKWEEYIKENPKFKVRPYKFNDDLYF